MGTQRMEWGVASLPLPGQVKSGDLHVVEPFPDGVLVAVVDGLGHGEEAGAAAEIAAATLREHARHSVVSLVKRCHERLKGKRGVAMTLASFNALDETMTWLAVGNVEGVLVRASIATAPVKESVLLCGGVVGDHFPPLHASVIPLLPGDTVILATDGIGSGFADSVHPGEPPQHIADRVLAGFAKGIDDALVLVARWNRGTTWPTPDAS